MRKCKAVDNPHSKAEVGTRPARLALLSSQLVQQTLHMNVSVKRNSLKSLNYALLDAILGNIYTAQCGRKFINYSSRR
jgi:hypothetical protein